MNYQLRIFLKLRKANTKNMTALVVDLDGTLLKTDLLFESALSFLKRNPVNVFIILWWLLSGKTSLKEKLAKHIEIDLSIMPVNKNVLDLIHKSKKEGKKIYLATASHFIYAKKSFDYFMVFESFFSTEGTNNLSCKNKRDQLVSFFGCKKYDYIGDSNKDISVWQSARKCYIVSNSSLSMFFRFFYRELNLIKIGKTKSLFKLWTVQLRLHQWSKNLLIFVPLIASHLYFDFTALSSSVLAFVLFSIGASGVYVLNDLLDLNEDRKHKSKRERPFASGDLKIKHGIVLTPILFSVSAVGSYFFMNKVFFFSLVIYLFFSILYSFYLKKVILIDVLSLAALYTIRIISGSCAIKVDMTFWLFCFSIFIFFSLALMKRYGELVKNSNQNSNNHNLLLPGRDYMIADGPIVSSLGIASGLISVLVWSLFIDDASISSMYRSVEYLWLSCLVLLFWISRGWILTHRGKMHDDPIIFAIKDRVSLISGALFVLFFLLAR